MNDNQSPFGPVQKWGQGLDGTTSPAVEPGSTPAPKKPWWRRAWVGAAATLLLGFGMGRALAADPEMNSVPAPTVTVTASPAPAPAAAPVTTEVTKEVTPQSCLDALAEGEVMMGIAGTALGLSAEGLGLVPDILTAVMEGDVLFLERATEKLDGLTISLTEETGKLQTSQEKYLVAAQECRAS